MKEEYLLWQGKPSQVVNIITYFKYSVYMVVWLWICNTNYVQGFLSAYITFIDVMYLQLSLPVILLIKGVWYALHIYMIKYELNTETLTVKSGIFTRYQDEVELYRIKDYILIAPLLLRLFGLSHLTLISSDRNTPKLTLHAIANAPELKNQIRAKVEELRVRKRVMEID